MKYEAVAKKIIGLKRADLEFREKLIQGARLGEGYDEGMANLHNRNAKILEDIIDEIGYPSVHKVGKEASEAAWMVVQHAIGQPHFMKKYAKLLKTAVNENKADPKSLAYLTDRIAVFQGKKQLYGTQFDWDEKGQMSPNPFDDIEKVNQRRKALGFRTLEEQTEILRARVEHEGQRPPEDYKERKRVYDNWRKTVGWMK